MLYQNECENLLFVGRACIIERMICNAWRNPYKLSQEVLIKKREQRVKEVLRCFRLSFEVDNRENPTILHARVLNAHKFPTFLAQLIQLVLHIIDYWLASPAYRT